MAYESCVRMVAELCASHLVPLLSRAMSPNSNGLAEGQYEHSIARPNVPVYKAAAVEMPQNQHELSNIDATARF